MGVERSSNYYNTLYSAITSYSKTYIESPYIYVWDKTIDMLSDDEVIVEVGCGTGQLANYILEVGLKYVYGFDFSNTAIAIAKKQNPNHADLFHVKNALLLDTYLNLPKYDTVICLETLEHIIEDFKILWCLKKGCRVIFSVPDFDFEAHVRHFKNAKEIITRYSNVLDIKSIYEIPHNNGNSKIFLCDSIRK